MKKNFSTFVLFLLLIGAFPVSCDLICWNPCGCGEYTPAKDFQIKEFQIINFIQGQVYNPEVYYNKDEFFKVLDIKEYEFLTQSESKNIGAGLIQGVYACDPLGSKSTEILSEILVINKKEWISSESEIFPIGSDISSLFTISNYPNLAEESILDYLESEKNFYLGDALYFRWNSALEEEIELVFDIEIKMSDGTSFNFQEEKMRLQK